MKDSLPGFSRKLSAKTSDGTSTESGRRIFTETFGEDLGRHFHGKWTAYFNGNLWDMLAYFRGESANGRKFCDMLLRQVSLYKKNRQRPVSKNNEEISKDITDNLKPLNHGTL